MRSLADFFKELDPIPPEHQDLAERFDAENQAALARLIPSAYMVFGILLTFFPIITDLFLYSDYTLTLVLLRIPLFAAFVLPAVLAHWFYQRGQIYLLAFYSVMIMFIIISIMLVVNRDPTGLYAAPFFVVSAILCLFPWPTRWTMTTIIGITLIYVLPSMLVGSFSSPAQVGEFGAFAGFLVLGIPVYTVIHTRVMRQRWENFLNRQRVQALNAELRTFNDNLQKELTLAFRIQQSLLLPPRPSWNGIDVVCASMPAREVGGDFYTYSHFTDEHVVMAVGDVSGKGMPAALLMSVSLAVLQSSIQPQTTPGSLLNSMDQTLVDYTRSTRQNCALCYAELNGATVHVANAGCIAPLLRKSCNTTEWTDVGGMPLGVGLGSKMGYPEMTISLSAGDMLFLFSDGTVEAMNGAGEMFGFERLTQAVAQGPTSSAEAMLLHLIEAIEHFVADAEPHDDITMIVIRKL